MKIKLYSGSHINSANKIFPHKIGNLVWHNSKWTDEEINELITKVNKYYEKNSK